MSDPAYRINGEGIAHEVLEGEAILINFKTGSYYSLDGVGGTIWQYLCAAPVSATTLAATLTDSTDKTALRPALDAFLNELLREELIVQTTDAALPVPTAVPLPAPFEPPVLRKYTDLEALLLLDPIHDVDVTGWPSTRQQQ